MGAIQQAEQDIQDMKDAGFSVKSVNDILIEAKQGLSDSRYDEALKHTKEISATKIQAYEVLDTIKVLETKINEYKEQEIDISEEESLLNEAQSSFEKERYDSAQDILSQINSGLDKKKAEHTTFNVLVNSGKGLIEKNWLTILITGLIIFICGIFGWKKLRIIMIKRKLDNLKIEQESLLKLMKETQTKRFKQGNMSRDVYDIRMAKYNSRVNEIKETIPVLEAQLSKNKK